jgi:hypothetical protein
MTRRLIFWATAGLFVGVAWVAYAFATMPDIEVQLSAVERSIRAVAYVTCPVIAFGFRFYWVPPINAASYALLGFVFESIRKNETDKRRRQARQ